MRLPWSRPMAVLALFSTLTPSIPASAAQLTAADRAWIDSCVAQRKNSSEKPARLRTYCACMQAIVEDNQPFDTVTALERTYPPAHAARWKKEGR